MAGTATARAARPAPNQPAPNQPAPNQPAPNQPAPNQPAGPPRLDPHSRLILRELHITSEGDQYLVGDVARGEFVSVPPIAVTVIEALRAGGTLAETAERVRAETGTRVDVADFAATLVDLGFVARLDGVPLGSLSPDLTGGGPLGAVAARLARPLYSRPAFALYGLLFAGCAALLTAVPQLRPHVTQLFFLPNPVLSIAALAAIGMPLAMTHELAHWLGARVNGVPARITISRRYYMLVAQTDLSALWAVPRRRRFPPLLAGIAWDTVRLSALIAARAAQLAGWWHPGPLAARLIAALIVTHVLSISWQFFVFLRTDIYAVLATGLGCLNLTEISRLWMARRYRKLTSTEEAELAAASPRDLTAARWYGWVQAGGLAAVTFYFFAFVAPFAISITRWVIDGLARNPAGTSRFWEVLASGIVILVPAAVPPLSYLRDRRGRG
jgi:putative peptide zinc metalloprotease protein